MVRVTAMILFLSIWICTGDCDCLHAQDSVRNSVVKIHTTLRMPDYYRPWAKSSLRESGGTGVFIDCDIVGEGDYVLTNAHVVQFASQIYVQPNRTTNKLAATIVAIAPGIDLALLKLDDPAESPDHERLPLAEELPRVKDTVNAYGFPIGGDELSITEGIVSRIEFAVFFFDVKGVRIQIDAALNPGNSGGPAVKNDHIVGLVFSGIREADNIGYLISADEIRLFLHDIEDGVYNGKPAVWGSFSSAENDALREHLALDNTKTGIVVTEPYSDDEDYPLKRWDVITHLGSHSLDNRGKVQVRDDLRLHSFYLVPQLVEKEGLELTVFRKGEELKVLLPVQSDRDRLIPILKYNQPEYAIFGPLGFTVAYHEVVRRLATHSKWGPYLMVSENPLLERFNDKPAFPGEQLVIVPSKMFPHPMTNGYSSPRMDVLTHVNDQPVKSLSHLVELLRGATGEYLEFRFGGLAEALVFHREEFLESTEGILEAEGIRRRFSPRIREVWDSTGG